MVEKPETAVATSDMSCQQDLFRAHAQRAIEANHFAIEIAAIHDMRSFNMACQYANGAIIGSEFIRLLEKHGSSNEKIYSSSTKVQL